LKLLCGLLDSAVRLSFREGAELEPPEDVSTVWRHAVEASSQDLSPTLIQGVRGLLVSALRGRIPLDEAGSLVVRFFEKADARVRAHAMETAGRILAGDEKIPPEVIERLKHLWQLRFTATRTSPDANRAELSAFSSWFTSRKFDDEWALAQLNTVLKLIGNLQHDFDVPERLAELAPQYPLETVECLRLMIDGAKEAWQISQWVETPRKILQAAKESGDVTVIKAVDDVVNRLGARGFFEFRDLLS